MTRDFIATTAGLLFGFICGYIYWKYYDHFLSLEKRIKLSNFDYIVNRWMYSIVYAVVGFVFACFVAFNY